MGDEGAEAEAGAPGGGGDDGGAQGGGGGGGEGRGHFKTQDAARKEKSCGEHLRHTTLHPGQPLPTWERRLQETTTQPQPPSG